MSKQLSSSVLAGWLVLCSLPAAAQEAAMVRGIVQGPDGARLPGVAITVIARGDAVAQVVSGEQGAYRVSGLRPGRYVIRGELQDSALRRRSSTRRRKTR